MDEARVRRRPDVRRASVQGDPRWRGRPRAVPRVPGVRRVKIQQRPMVVDGEIKARPMMYLALSYDHRIVDGKEAVTFLVRVKEAIEDPQRLVLDL